MPTTIFRPTSPTNQNRPKVKISNFRVFCPIWMKFGKGAKHGNAYDHFSTYQKIINFNPHEFLIPSRTTIIIIFAKTDHMDHVWTDCKTPYMTPIKRCEPVWPRLEGGPVPAGFACPPPPPQRLVILDASP